MSAMTSVKNEAIVGLENLTASPPKHEIPASLKYLDLAGVYQYGRWKIRVVDCLDLAIPKFEEVFIVVPLGKQKLVNRVVLKQAGSAKSFVLYPNLPLELRQKIIDKAISGRDVQVNLTDNGIGQWVGQAHCFESVMIASKEIFQYLSSQYRYHEIFKNGTTKHSANIDGRVCLALMAATPYPSLDIKSMFSAKLDLANVQWLRFDLCHLDNDNAAQWVHKNIVGLPNLKFLRINFSIQITNPEQQEVSFQVLSEDITRSRRDYVHQLTLENGNERFVYEDIHAMREIGNLVAKQPEEQAIMYLWMMIDRCLRDQDRFPTFPAWVTMKFRWVAGNSS